MNEDGAKNDRTWIFSWTLAKKVGTQKQKIAEMEFENGELKWQIKNLHDELTAVRKAAKEQELKKKLKETERRLLAFKRELALSTDGIEIFDDSGMQNETEKREHLGDPIDLTEN